MSCQVLNDKKCPLMGHKYKPYTPKSLQLWGIYGYAIWILCIVACLRYSLKSSSLPVSRTQNHHTRPSSAKKGALNMLNHKQFTGGYLHA